MDSEAGEAEDPRPDTMLQELLSMGFPEPLSAAALSATGSKSTSLAADWILNHPNPSPPPVPHYFQPPNKRPKNGSSPRPPLAERMRPLSLSDVLGQDHLLPTFSLHPLPSLILWGPPGSGKTSIARALARSLPSHRFVPLSAVTSGVKDIRPILDSARARRQHSLSTLLFVDEIHRFNRSQLDSFLPPIEDGTVTLVGATTENPSFHLPTPLLSRCRVLSLRPLRPHHISSLLSRALSDAPRGIPDSSADPGALEFLSARCDGDARVALNALEAAASLASRRNGPIVITAEDVKEAMQCKHVAYDRAGEEHYNLISALHKSMRGGDGDAAVYWLARMLEGGERPLYIARRLVRFASEDVGLADPNALVQAVACYQACHFLGLPECDVNLAQCVVYLARAPKSIVVYRGLGAARDAVRESAGGNEGVPLHLRNAPTNMMRELGYGEGYVYPPDHPELPPQSFLPPSLVGRKFLEWTPLPAWDGQDQH